MKEVKPDNDTIAGIENMCARLWSYQLSHGLLTVKFFEKGSSSNDGHELKFAFCEKICLSDFWEIKNPSITRSGKLFVYKDSCTEIQCRDCLIVYKNA